MPRIHWKCFFWTLVTLTAIFTIVPTAAAKKKAVPDSGRLKKVIAIGHVDTGMLGFQSKDPDQLSDLFRNRIQKQIASKGFVVLLPKQEKTKETTSPTMTAPSEELPSMPEPKTAAEAMRYATQMQKMMQQMTTEMRGGYIHKPVAAQALFTFVVGKQEKSVTSGGIFSSVESFTGAPIGDADFTSDSIGLSLNCRMLDPQSGSVLDQHVAKASSTRYSRIGGASYYTMEDTSDPDRAYDRMFKRAVENCAKWIEKKMAPLPWEAAIADVRGSTYIINAGSDAGIEPEMTLGVFERTAVTGGGLALGEDEQKIGTIKVTEVKPLYAKGRLIEGKAKKGAHLKTLSH